MEEPRAPPACSTSGDLDRAVESLLDRAERDGLFDVAYANVDSPFGRLLLARTDRGVVKLALPSHQGSQSRGRGPRAARDADLSRGVRGPLRARRGAPPRLDDYFDGSVTASRSRSTGASPPPVSGRTLPRRGAHPLWRDGTYAEIARSAGNNGPSAPPEPPAVRTRPRSSCRATASFSPEVGSATTAAGRSKASAAGA